MITNYVPSAVVVHDQLHIRGGHQVSWLLDGVPVPNTNIASKRWAAIRTQGHRLHRDSARRILGAVWRSHIRSLQRGDALRLERNREGEAVINYGSYNTTNNQLSFGDHTQRFAYYASVSGNRTDLGLETPTAEVIHDMNSGGGGFLSLIFNKTPNDQLRFVGSARADHYQVPNTS